MQFWVHPDGAVIDMLLTWRMMVDLGPTQLYIYYIIYILYYIIYIYEKDHPDSGKIVIHNTTHKFPSHDVTVDTVFRFFCRGDIMHGKVSTPLISKVDAVISLSSGSCLCKGDPPIFVDRFTSSQRGYTGYNQDIPGIMVDLYI